MESKSVIKSKINLMGLIMVILGAITDPMFRQYFGDFIPVEWFGRITFLAGWAIIWFRSNGQANIPLDWKNPWKGAAVLLVAISLGTLCACATISAVKSDATPKQIAQAICSDLQTTSTAASALLAWTTIYFPNQAALLSQASTYLELAEESRSAACAAVDLVVDSESLATLITSKQNEVLSLIGRINSIIAKIKGTSTAAIEIELQDYKFEAQWSSLAPLARQLKNTLEAHIAQSAHKGLSGASVGM